MLKRTKQSYSMVLVYIFLFAFVFTSCINKKDYIFLNPDSVSASNQYILSETVDITENTDPVSFESHEETECDTAFEGAAEVTGTEALPVTSEKETVYTPDGSEGICVISLTDAVKRGGKAKLVISGFPNTEYTIKVYYSTTVSTAKGLEAKISDESGTVEWEWRVGSRTKPGSHKIVVSGGESTLTVLFTTLE